MTNTNAQTFDWQKSKYSQFRAICLFLSNVRKDITPEVYQKLACRHGTAAKEAGEGDVWIKVSKTGKASAKSKDFLVSDEIFRVVIPWYDSLLELVKATYAGASETKLPEGWQLKFNDVPLPVVLEKFLDEELLTVS